MKLEGRWCCQCSDLVTEVASPLLAVNRLSLFSDPEVWLKGKMVRDLRHQMALSGESPVQVVESTQMVLKLDSRPKLSQRWWKVLLED